MYVNNVNHKIIHSKIEYDYKLLFVVEHMYLQNTFFTNFSCIFFSAGISLISLFGSNKYPYLCNA